MPGGLAVRLATACLLAAVLGADRAGVAETLRVQISWGGGPAKQWGGSIWVESGAVAEPRPLGIEADEPGSMWLDGQRLVVAQRSPRTYDGVELTVTASLEALLHVSLAPIGSPPEAEAIGVPLGELVDGQRNIKLDGDGNRLFMRRAPGDRLRVEVDRSTLVFDPGESVHLTIAPHLLPVDPESELEIRIALVRARGEAEYWSTEHAVAAGAPVAIQQEVRLPEEEGAYAIAITARHTPGIRLPQPGRLLSSGEDRPSGSRLALGPKQTVAERRIQLLVLAGEGPVVAAAEAAPLAVVDEIDPANPSWWDRLTRPPNLPRLQRWWRGPLGSGHSAPMDHPLGRLLKLGPAPTEGDVAWEAYPLSVERPGRPHVLEISYPSDVPQTLAISLIEPNVAGAVVPLGIDSGVDLSAEATDGGAPPEWRRHRIVFWPKTKTPLVLVANRRRGSPAVCGKIRLLAGWEHLPPATGASGPSGGRLVAAYMARPLVPENFSATEARGSLSNLGMDDWVTFYQGGTRLVEYLQYVGYGGLMLTVWADGSTIYPSAILEPTPRYDTGVFLDSARDPVRKDGLEMLFRLFDREGLVLIPAFQFAAPIPALEAQLRTGGAEAEGIRWVGPDGRSWLETHTPRRGLAPYYNVLDPRVQEAMLSVVREVVDRYGRHPSFQGLAVQLTAHGYAQLPGPAWGLDDTTIARFQEATGVAVPGSGPGRFAARAVYLVARDGQPPSPPQRAWIAWRGETLHGFFRRVHEVLTAVRPQGRVYLAATGMFTDHRMQQLLRRSLSQGLTATEALEGVGIDPRLYEEDEGVVLLAPGQVMPVDLTGAHPFPAGVDFLPETGPADSGLAGRGGLFFHRPQELRLASFDRKCPHQPCYTWLATQPIPSGPQNRRRFVHCLAARDATVLFDGGWQVPLGGEEAIRPLVRVLRRLPAVPMRRVASPQGESTQPVTVRTGTHEGQTYCYLANDAPFPVRASLTVRGLGDGQIHGLDPASPAPPGQLRDGTWTVDLGPYDLVAARFSSADVALAFGQVSWPDQVKERLRAKIEQLSHRMLSLRAPRLVRLLENPGFEQSPADSGEIPGWAATEQPGVTITLDPNQKHGGARSVRMASVGPVATLISHPFRAPATGMLMMHVALRCEDPSRQPPLRIALVGRYQGADFVRLVHAGPGPGPQLQLRRDWQWFPVLVNDLPLEDLSPLQVRFDLLGPGEVWIDELVFEDVWFDDTERKVLFKMIAPARGKLDRGEVADCLQLLDSYWPRFLLTHVSPAQPPVARAPEPTTPPPPGSERPERTSSWLGNLRDLLRF